MIEQFPLATWRRLMLRALGDDYRSYLSYGPAAGLPVLREAIARHLSLKRATMCSPQQVLVLNSPMQAVELVGRVLLEPGDKVWLEDPGHPSLVSLFQVLRAQVIGVPLDARGLDVAAGRAAAPDAAAVYLHPLTQFPLGVRTDRGRRADLLQVGRRGRRLDHRRQLQRRGRARRRCAGGLPSVGPLRPRAADGHLRRHHGRAWRAGCLRRSSRPDA